MDSDPLSSKVLPADAWGTYLSFYGPYAAILIVLLALAAIVSASEAAFFSLSSDDRAICRSSDEVAERRIMNLLDRPRRLLASLLIFNNLLNLAIVVIVTYLVWKLSQLDPTSGWVLTSLTAVLTLTIVLFGEIIPKVYASQNSLSVARRTAPLVALASTLFRPLSVLLVSLTSVIDQRIQRRGYKVSMVELNQAVELTSRESTHEERELIKGIVNFSNLTARQAMRARVDITAFSEELTFTELLAQINQSGYSRVPVYKESLDEIEGILYLKDLLPHLDSDDSFRWQTLIRPVFFIPETKKIDDLLQDFQKRRVHMAIVVDEYGGTRGLITLEDIIEEIFGDINDEFDEEEPIPFQRVDDRTIRVEGKILLTDICRVLQVDITYFDEVKGESESLGGLLLELFTRVPQTGQEVSYGEFTFKVLSADDKRIQHVEIVRQETPS
ncbi:gliding motility-associated protein GldE [Larkinella punicea]|uniref:Gliding motility-associated protein GldE n=1 Tax=Larkinella punicea TaxID=2315727 RepID=A0A368JJG4_9BACT|nr:gliding motility-associated protein GldE [Larkinella punicea]RCR67435.1 gliding motility-associated protein GldE [Larkinella punicea]